MALSITVDLKDKSVSELELLETSLRPAAVNAAVASGGRFYLRAWFYRLDSERANKLGGRRTHFYGDAGRSTTYQIVTNGVVFGIAKQGIRQRLEGGTIVPRGYSKITGRKLRNLTIPATAEAYGKRASEFDLEFAMVQDGGHVRPALVEKGETKAMYWLVPRVVQQKDPSVLPTNEQLREALLQEVRKAIALRRN
jgi:hypothetical protein